MIIWLTFLLQKSHSAAGLCVKCVIHFILRFDVDSPDFFSDSVKITVASYILEREKFGPEDQDKGIKQLIADGTYKAAYPLHDVKLLKLLSSLHNT